VLNDDSRDEFDATVFFDHSIALLADLVGFRTS
jgi:hypothetical protein